MTKDETPRVVVTDADWDAVKHWLDTPDVFIAEAFARDRAEDDRMVAEGEAGE